MNILHFQWPLLYVQTRFKLWLGWALLHRISGFNFKFASILFDGRTKQYADSSMIQLPQKYIIHFFQMKCRFNCVRTIIYIKKLYGPLFSWMGFNCLKATATSRGQFSFYHLVCRISWYSFYRPRKDERLSRPWRHPVVLNTGPLDWESSVLTTRPLLHIYQSIPHNKYLNPQAPKDALCVYVISEKAVYAILQCHWY